MACSDDRELIVPVRTPMHRGDDSRTVFWHLTRTWYLFFEQLANLRLRVCFRTLVLKDTTVGNDIADHVTAYRPGTGCRITGVLRKVITSDLTVRINKNGAAFITLTIPSATAVDVPVTGTMFAGSAAIADKDVFSFDVTASDGQTDKAGVATFTLEWV